MRALQASNRFRVRALTRNPDQHRGLADEVVAADLNRPQTLRAAFEGAHGVFLVTNFWEPGVDERKQATAAILAAKDAGVEHLVWSTLPNVESISGGRLDVPHFTGKAKIDRFVEEAAFANHTFVIAPMYYQNLVGLMAPQKQRTARSAGRSLSIPMCVASTWGTSVNWATSLPALSHTRTWQAMASILPLVGDFLSFNDIIDTLNRQGHKFTFRQVPIEVFAASFPGAAEVGATFRHFEAHTYLGSPSHDRIALANKVAGRQPSTFSTWARVNFPA